MFRYFVFIFSILFLTMGVPCAVLAAETEPPVIVVIDPGHGGEPGETEANGGAFYHDVYEKDLNLETALAMQEMLEEYQGIEVYITRTTDQEMSLKERADFAKEKNADMFISIHYNASADHLFYGSEVWVSAFGEYYAQGYALATHFMEEFRGTGLIDRGIKTRIGDGGSDYYGVIRHCAEYGIPAVIVEHCYLDDDTEYGRVDTGDERKLFGIRDAMAVVAYYGLEKDSVPDKIVPSPSIVVPQEPVLPDDTEPQDIVCSIKSYDRETGSADVLITADEAESNILYYGYSVDGGRNFSRLFLWEGSDEMEVQIPIGKEAAGTLQIRLYNNYNMKGDSNRVVFDYRTQEEKAQSRKSYDFDEVYEITQLPENVEESTGEAAVQRQADPIDAVLLILLLLFFLLAGVLASLLMVIHLQKKREQAEPGQL